VTPGAVRRAASATVAFLVDFLVGDTPELFVAALVVVGAAFALAHAGAAGVVIVPAVAVLSVLWSASRGRRRAISAATPAPGQRTQGSPDVPPAGA
jgi:hypothetical protein